MRKVKKIIFILVCLLSAPSVYLYAQGYTSSHLGDPFQAIYPKKIALKIKVEEKKIEAEEIIIPPEIIVEALVAGGRAPRAIVGGKILKIGEKIAGTDAILTKINKDGIEVLYKLKNFFYAGPAGKIKGNIIRADKPKEGR